MGAKVMRLPISWIGLNAWLMSTFKISLLSLSMCIPNHRKKMNTCVYHGSQAGTDDTKWMTPLKVKQAVEYQTAKFKKRSNELIRLSSLKIPFYGEVRRIQLIDGGLVSLWPNWDTSTNNATCPVRIQGLDLNGNIVNQTISTRVNDGSNIVGLKTFNGYFSSRMPWTGSGMMSQATKAVLLYGDLYYYNNNSKVRTSIILFFPDVYKFIFIPSIANVTYSIGNTHMVCGVSSNTTSYTIRYNTLSTLKGLASGNNSAYSDYNSWSTLTLTRSAGSSVNTYWMFESLNGCIACISIPNNTTGNVTIDVFNLSSSGSRSTIYNASSVSIGVTTYAYSPVNMYISGSYWYFLVATSKTTFNLYRASTTSATLLKTINVSSYVQDIVNAPVYILVLADYIIFYSHYDSIFSYGAFNKTSGAYVKSGKLYNIVIGTNNRTGDIRSYENCFSSLLNKIVFYKRQYSLSCVSIYDVESDTESIAFVPLNSNSENDSNVISYYMKGINGTAITTGNSYFVDFRSFEYPISES